MKVFIENVLIYISSEGKYIYIYIYAYDMPTHVFFINKCLYICRLKILGLFIAKWLL